jgi:hypothetical protein
MMQGIVARQILAICGLIAFATGNATSHGRAVGRITLLDVALSQLQQ